MSDDISLEIASVVTALNNKYDLDRGESVESILPNKMNVDAGNRSTDINIRLAIAASPAWYKRKALFTPNKTTITIHENTQVNIGNNGYISTSDVTLSLNSIATAANRAGKDVYIYACVGSGTEPTFVLSTNSTVPTGYTADNSRKIGGFHCLCKDVGTISGHTLSGYVAGDILPLSVWDLLHRPVSDPEGMVYALGKWFDIYLASWDGSKLVSVYNGVVCDSASTEKFSGEKFAEKMGLVNKKLIAREDFIVVAKGSNENTNITGSTDPNTTGGHVDTANRRMISNYGLEDCCGAYWQWTSDTWGHFSASASTDSHHQYGGMEQSAVGTNHYLVGYNWNNKSVYLPSIDGDAQPYGSSHGALTRALVGAHWRSGSGCGSRAVLLDNLSSYAYSAGGARGFSSSKNTL